CFLFSVHLWSICGPADPLHSYCLLCCCGTRLERGVLDGAFLAMDERRGPPVHQRAAWSTLHDREISTLVSWVAACRDSPSCGGARAIVWRFPAARGWPGALPSAPESLYGRRSWRLRCHRSPLRVPDRRRPRSALPTSFA